jgi:hypothetical protein
MALLTPDRRMHTIEEVTDRLLKQTGTVMQWEKEDPRK